MVDPSLGSLLRDRLTTAGVEGSATKTRAPHRPQSDEAAGPRRPPVRPDRRPAPGRGRVQPDTKLAAAAGAPARPARRGRGRPSDAHRDAARLGGRGWRDHPPPAARHQLPAAWYDRAQAGPHRGEHAVGGNREFAGVLGTQAVKVFDLAAAGLRPKERHLKSGRPASIPRSVESDADDHKAYYLGAHQHPHPGHRRHRHPPAARRANGRPPRRRGGQAHRHRRHRHPSRYDRRRTRRPGPVLHPPLRQPSGTRSRWPHTPGNAPPMQHRLNEQARRTNRHTCTDDHPMSASIPRRPWPAVQQLRAARHRAAGDRRHRLSALPPPGSPPATSGSSYWSNPPATAAGLAVIILLVGNL